jgi:hypothetical protein
MSRLSAIERKGLKGSAKRRRIRKEAEVEAMIGGRNLGTANKKEDTDQGRKR